MADADQPVPVKVESFTVVGDRAQARDGCSPRRGRSVSNGRFARHPYRRPVRQLPDPGRDHGRGRSGDPRGDTTRRQRPRSIRSSAIPVTRAGVDDLESVVDGWLREHTDGTACVIGESVTLRRRPAGAFTDCGTAKGLEFDLVVLVAPGLFGDGWLAQSTGTWR